MPPARAPPMAPIRAPRPALPLKEPMAAPRAAPPRVPIAAPLPVSVMVPSEAQPANRMLRVAAVAATLARAVVHRTFLWCDCVMELRPGPLDWGPGLGGDDTKGRHLVAWHQARLGHPPPEPQVQGATGLGVEHDLDQSQVRAPPVPPPGPGGTPRRRSPDGGADGSAPASAARSRSWGVRHRASKPGRPCWGR